MRRSLGTLAAVASLTPSLTSCSTNEPVDVLAASSFTDVAGDLEQLLERELGVDVRFSFGSSGSFREQLHQGAPAAVVVTADAATMAGIEDAGLVAASVPISSNRLVIVTADTAAGRRIASLADLASTDAVVVLCASSAPCGAASDVVLRRAGVEVAPASREPNVRATLTKVLLGEADAALVYRTDALAHPELRAVELDDDVNVAVTGRAAAVTERGAEVVELLAGPDAAAILAGAGFDAP